MCFMQFMQLTYAYIRLFACGISITTHWQCAFHLDFFFQRCYFKNHGLAYSKILWRCVLQNIMQSSMCHSYWSEMWFSQTMFIQLTPSSVFWNINEAWWKNEGCINEQKIAFYMLKLLSIHSLEFRCNISIDWAKKASSLCVMEINRMPRAFSLVL